MMIAPVKLPVTPSMSLAGRRALVTGAGRGLGAAAAAALAGAGAELTLAARSQSELDQVAAELRQRGARVDVLPLDVLDSAAVSRKLAAHGPWQVLVNSAGTNRPARLVDTDDTDIAHVLDLNLRSTMWVCREVARGMLAQGQGGSIITISSQMGHVGGPLRSVYCASKHAIEGMTKALAWEWGSQGIRVNTICPTFIETQMTAPMLSDPVFRDFVQSKIALGRVGTLEDVMGAVVFLAGDAAALVTGSALMVDGGWTAA